jgi:hypothetical protein
MRCDGHRASAACSSAALGCRSCIRRARVHDDRACHRRSGSGGGGARQDHGVALRGGVVSCTSATEHQRRARERSPAAGFVALDELEGRCQSRAVKSCGPSGSRDLAFEEEIDPSYAGRRPLATGGSPRQTPCCVLLPRISRRPHVISDTRAHGCLQPVRRCNGNTG